MARAPVGRSLRLPAEGQCQGPERVAPPLVCHQGRPTALLQVGDKPTRRDDHQSLERVPGQGASRSGAFCSCVSVGVGYSGGLSLVVVSRKCPFRLSCARHAAPISSALTAKKTWSRGYMRSTCRSASRARITVSTKLRSSSRKTCVCHLHVECGKHSWKTDRLLRICRR
jgi:hypothetical protein